MRNVFRKVFAKWIFGELSILEMLGYLVVAAVTVFIGLAIVSAILQLPTVF